MRLLVFSLILVFAWQQLPIKNCKVVTLDNNYVSVLMMIKGQPNTIGVIRDKDCQYSQIKVGDSVWINPTTHHIYKNSEEKPE